MSEITCIFGKRGAGKSTLAKILQRRATRVIILDPLAEYSSLSIQCDTLELLVKYILSNKTFRLSYVYDDKSEYLSEIIYKLGNVLFVVEEVDLVCNLHSSQYWFDALIKRGRHRDVSLLTTSRRPAEVSRLLTSQAHNIYAFNTTEPNDIKYLSGYVGKDAERLIEIPIMNFIHFPSKKVGKILDYSRIDMYNDSR